MPRPKKTAPNRTDGRYEIKRTIGKRLDGSPIQKSFYSAISKADAIKKYEEYKVAQKVADITGIGQDTSVITFAAWAETWLEKYKHGSVKENTFEKTYVYTVERHLLPELGPYLLTSISSSDLQLFMNKKASKYSDTILKKVANCLYAIFETAVENDLCFKNPAKNLVYKSKKKKKEKRTYTQEQVDLIMEYASIHKYGLYIRLLLELGLRCSELCGLMWKDIDFKNKTIHICRASTGLNGHATVDLPKSGTSIRVLPLSTSLCELLKKESAGKSGYICQTQQGGVFEDTGFTRTRYDIFFKDMKKEAKYAHIERLTPHEMRHTCGTLLYARTGDIYAISKYMGHSSVEVTAKYYIHDDTNLLRTHLKIA